MAEHYCQQVTHWPKDQDDKLIRCDRPAGLKLNQRWFCAEHYDWRMSLPDLIDINFTITERKDGD